MGLRIYHGDALARYGFGGGHPFGPDRLDAFWTECVARGLDRRAEIASPVQATEAELLRFHTPEYVTRVREASVAGTGFLDYGDTPAFPGVYEAAATVVGSVLDAVRWILADQDRQAFVPIAGLHHAHRNSAAGFCVFNDIGVAIETLRAEFRIHRVAYVDIDAHHADGVYYAFADDPELIFADFHEDGRFLYPGTGDASETGSGAALGTKLNLPLAPGSGDAQFQALWPKVEAFVRQGRPEFIILQAGADSIGGDPLTHLQFSPSVHGHAARQLRDVARQHCGGRLLALGGGGYNRDSLASAWCAVVQAMLD
jgi:acetoin utilization protein AcuC